jgi:TonB family protein
VPRTRPDSSLTALRNTGARPGQVLDVVVLTADASLLGTLRETAGPEHALWHAPTADAAVDFLVGGRCSILIADLGTLRGDAASLLDRLQLQFPELLMMATGRREQESAVAALVTSGRIYRFLHKPVSPARASLFLSAATRRYNELRDAAEPAALATVRMVAQRPYMGTFMAAAAGIVGAVIAFGIWQAHHRSLPETPQRTNIGNATPEEQVAAKLASAQVAYLAGRLSEPRGDNALEYYRAVLTLQPKNEEALAGVNRVIDALAQRVDDALKAENAPKVVAAWTALQQAAPQHPRLNEMRDQLLALTRSGKTKMQDAANSAIAKEKARRAAAPPPETRATPAPERERAPADAPVKPDAAPDDERLDQPARQPLAQAPTPAPTSRSIADLVNAVVRLRERGALTEPENANAYDAILMLRERFPNSEEVIAEQRRLAALFMDRARTALAAGNVDEASIYIKGADKLVPGMTALAPLQQQLAVAQEQRNFMTNIVQAAALRRIREVPPVYPRDAARDGKEGSVQVEFTIAPDGTTQDLVVRDANPPQVFDKAAVDSVRRWRFEPIKRNGIAVPQRAVLQVRFVLEKK